MTTVVALHGFSSGPSAFSAIRDALPEGVDFVAPAIAGHGPSPRSPVSFDAEVDFVASIVRALVGRVVLVGYSLGGRIALATVERVSVAGLVIVSAHPGLADASERAVRLADDVALAASLRGIGVDRFFDAWEGKPLFATQKALDPAIRRARSALRRSHEVEPLALALERLSLGAMPNTRGAIAAFRGPARFLAGELDTKFAELARESARLARRGEVDIVAGVGHDVLLEAEGRVLAQLESVLGEFE